MEKLIEKRGKFDGKVIGCEKQLITILSNDVIYIKLFSSVDIRSYVKENYKLSVFLTNANEIIIYDKVLDTTSKNYAITIALEYVDKIMQEKTKIFLINLSEELCRCKQLYSEDAN